MMKTRITLVLALIAASFTQAQAACTAADIDIKHLRPGWEQAGSYGYLKGVAVLTNNCSHPVGVELRVTGLDTDGLPVATRTLWPASVQNIAPGDYTFSLDHWLEYDRDIATIKLAPSKVTVW